MTEALHVVKQSQCKIYLLYQKNLLLYTFVLFHISKMHKYISKTAKKSS